MTDCTDVPLAGLWMPTQLKRVHYGPSSVNDHLLSTLPHAISQAFIVTNAPLGTNEFLLHSVETTLGSHHIGTFSHVQRQVSTAELLIMIEALRQKANLDTIISLGDDIPIDVSKTLSFAFHKSTGRFLRHIAIPTTLGAAECTFLTRYIIENGRTIPFNEPQLAPLAILYDPTFVAYTPPHLIISTGVLALDHALAVIYSPNNGELPGKGHAMTAVADLFNFLPKLKLDPRMLLKMDYVTKLQLASLNALGFLGLNASSSPYPIPSIGLSHSIGYAMSAHCGLPLDLTSCIILPSILRRQSRDAVATGQLARLLPFLGCSPSGNPGKDAAHVTDLMGALLCDLGVGGRFRDLDVKLADLGEVAGTVAKEVGLGRWGRLKVNEEVYRLLFGLW